MNKSKLSRQKAHRKMLARNLLTSLMIEKKIITTESKAKYVRPLADKILRSAISANDSTKRRIASIFTSNAAVKELFTAIVPKLPKNNGSLVKIIKISSRVGDQADQAALIIIKDVKSEENKIEKTVKKTSKAKSSVK